MRILPLVLLLALTGCASVHRETAAAMVTDPGGRSTAITPLPYDTAYRKTLQQMKACYEVGGAFMTHFSVYGDKSDKDAEITSALSGITGHRVLSTLRLKPTNSGTLIEIFAASEPLVIDMKSKIEYWLNHDGATCSPPPST